MSGVTDIPCFAVRTMTATPFTVEGGSCLFLRQIALVASLRLTFCLLLYLYCKSFRCFGCRVCRPNYRFQTGPLGSQGLLSECFVVSVADCPLPLLHLFSSNYKDTVTFSIIVLKLKLFIIDNIVRLLFFMGYLFKLISSQHYLIFPA